MRVLDIYKTRILTNKIHKNMKTIIENIILVIIAGFLVLMAATGMVYTIGHSTIIIAPAIYGVVMYILYRRGKLDKILH